MTPLVLFVTAFVVRAAVGTLFAGPAYPDSYYYVNLAQQLAGGHGLTIDYIWNFVEVGGQIPPDPILPIPANAHWLPLAAIVQVPFIWVLGATPVASGLPFWLIGAAAAPLTYAIGRDFNVGRMQSTAAGLLVAAPGGLMPFLSQPDNFGLYMTLAALALWLCARGLRGDRRAFVVGGAVVGLASLARSDGVLLGLPFALVVLQRLARGSDLRAWLIACVGCAAAFVLVYGPWLVRQLVVFGSVAPSATSGRILWLIDYNQLFSIGPPLGPADLLAQGLGPLLVSRVEGLLWALGLFALLPLVVVLVPFSLIGVWSKRRDQNFLPFFVYATALFLASALLFAVHVPHGTFIHSAAGLAPHAFLLTVIGICSTVDWVARRRATWDKAQATAVFTYGAVLIVFAGAAIQTLITTRNWAEVRGVQQRLAAALASASPADRIMAADAGAYRYVSGHPGIVTPDNPLPVIESAMHAYDVRWLALESTSIVPALAPLLTGAERPAWLSAPVAEVPGAVSSAPRGALFAVCFSPADVRCAP